MNITLRRASVDDATVLSAIAKETFYDTFVDTCSKEDMDGFLEHYFNVPQMRKELSDETDICFFAEIDGVPAGYIRFKEDYSSFDLMSQWKSLELKRIYVKKEFQGKGVAQHLMNLILTYANEQQYQVVYLGVWEHNTRAHRFYEKYGFKNSGHMHDFPIGNTPQQDYWFWKFLSATDLTETH